MKSDSETGQGFGNSCQTIQMKDRIIPAPKEILSRLFSLFFFVYHHQ